LQGSDSNEGEFLGEVPLLPGTPFFASLRALTSCRIARLDKQQFFHLIRDSEEARDMILRQMGKRLLMVQERTLSLEASRAFIFGRNRDADRFSAPIQVADLLASHQSSDAD
jgi:CRP-like cAMP-binding protein